MKIGVPKEIMKDEARVAASPETVKKMSDAGWTVYIENNAGLGAHYTNEEYVTAGATIIDDAQELYDLSELILKVKEPQFNQEKQKDEVDMMHKGQMLITFIHPASPINHNMVRKMANNGVNSITLDGIPRISRAQNMDALTSMSTCAGYKGILMAANYLPKFIPQIFSAVGMMKPLNALIIGSGVGGLQAIATAKRLGAQVYAADIRPDAIEQAKSLGAKVVDLSIPASEAVGEGGYAQELSADLLAVEREQLAKVLPDMDIVFCSALVPGKEAPILISPEMLKTMKSGSVIVDISIDQGGNCASTVSGEIAKVDQITIIGTKNIPGLLPVSSTWMFAQNMFNLINYLIKDGELVLDRSDEIIEKSLCTINGEIVHKGALEAMATHK